MVKQERTGRQKTALTELTEDFTLERTKAVITKRKQDEMLLAKARGELLVKSLVEKQAAYLLVALRQKIIAVPSTYARRILNVTDIKQANKILKDLSLSLLNEVRNLPEKVVDPHWFRDLEREDAVSDKDT